MKEKHPVLSISILISGRDEMKKTLKSLKPFLEELPCELILVDTGCSEEHLAIAREYTENIIPFTWCDDFAAARNTGLKAARGEWFMYLDDDEWFEDPSEIIAFFHSGEYKKFNCGYYKVRNHVDYSGENYVDSFVTRMVRKERETCFRGRIHEVINPTYEPVKMFQTHVEHYGYAYASEKENRRHTMRNVKPLIGQIEEEPDNLRWYAQLSQEYLSVHEYEKGEEIALEGIRRYEEGSRKELSQYRVYATLYGYAVLHRFNMEDISGAEVILEKGLTKIKGEKPYRAYLLQCATSIYDKLKRYSDCMRAAEEYLDIYDKIGSDERAITAGGFLVTESTFHDQLRAAAILRAVIAASIERDYDKLEYFFFRLDWQDPRMMQQQELEKYVLDAVTDAPHKESFTRMVKAMGERNGGMAELYPLFMQLEKQFKEDGACEKLERLRSLAAAIVSGHFYVLMSKIRCMDKTGDRYGIAGAFRDIFAKEENVLDIREDVWEIAERCQIPLEPLFLGMDFVKWKRMLARWVVIAPYEEGEAWHARCEKWECKNDIRCLLLKIRCKEIMLRQKGLGEDLETLEKRLTDYAEATLSYYGIFYKEEVFTACPEALPDEARLSLRYLDVEKARKAGDGHSILQALWVMLETYPVLEEAMLHYAKMVRDEVDRQSKEAVKAGKELNLLIRSLKGVAKQRIERKEYQEAKEILLQIQSCKPEDEEAGELLKRIKEQITK